MEMFVSEKIVKIFLKISNLVIHKAADRPFFLQYRED